LSCQNQGWELIEVHVRLSSGLWTPVSTSRQLIVGLVVAILLAQEARGLLAPPGADYT
jgi:hypothetical protein